MARIRVDPLNIKFPIVDPKTGTPTPAFMRLWQNLFGNDDDNATTIQDVVTDLRDNVIEAADGTIDVTGSGSLLDGPVKLAADPQAILNKLSSAQGSVLYRGATTWSALGPGTSGYVLTTNGASADPTWDAAASATPALTHSHIFVGNSSGVAADVAMSGDATIADMGAVMVLKTNGVAFGYFATGTDASNLSGTLNNARLNAVPNSALANSSVTLNSHSLSLGGSLTLTTTDIFADWSVSGHALTQSAVGANAQFILQGETGAIFQVTRYSTNANASQVSGRKARGTIASPTAVATSDVVFQQAGSGYGTSAFQTLATVRYVVEEPTPSDTAMGGSVRFLITSLGTVTSPEAVRLLAASQRFLGPVGIGQAVTNAPAAGFVLDLTSTTGALGVPSMTTTQKNALNGSSPVNRSIVYDSTLGKFQFREAGAWNSLGASPSLTTNHILVGSAGGIATDVAMSGDATIVASGALTLANSGVSAATYGDSTHVAQVTFDAKGRATSASNVALSGIPGGEFSINAMTAVPALPGWDPQFTGLPGDIVLSNSNKTATPASSTPWNHMMGTTARYTGKYYFEMKPASTSFAAVGVTGAAGHVKRGNGGQFGDTIYGGQIGLQPNGNVWSNPSSPVSAPNNFATVSSWAANDVISVAVDIDNNLIWFRTNAGNWNNSGTANPATGVGGLDLSWAWSGAANRLLWPGANMGNTAAIILRQITADFTQTVPSGFLSWSGL